MFLLSLLFLGPKVYAVSPFVFLAAKPITLQSPKDNPTKKPTYAIPLLLRACSCESWGDPNKVPRQFKEGVVLRGYPNPNDVGACQINETLWGKTAKNLGLDIENSLIDNVKMANYIYSKQGMNAWVWSKSCWDK